MNNLLSHVPFTRLVDLAEGRVPLDEQAQLIIHINTCSQCRAELAQLEHLIGIMRKDVAVDAPPAVIARAIRLFRPQQTPATPNLLQRLVATLQFDSAQLSPAFGVRSAPEGETAGARQLLYVTDEHDLDIRITPAGAAWIVAGQVLSLTTGGRVELQEGSRVVQTSLNEVSEFALPPTPSGIYTLTVHLPDAIVEVQALQVGV